MNFITSFANVRTRDLDASLYNPVISFPYCKKDQTISGVTARVKEHFEEFLDLYGDLDSNGLVICQSLGLHLNELGLEVKSPNRFVVTACLEGDFDRDCLRCLFQDIADDLAKTTNLRKYLASLDDAEANLKQLVEAHAADSVDITKRNFTVRRLGLGTAMELQ